MINDDLHLVPRIAIPECHKVYSENEFLIEILASPWLLHLYLVLDHDKEESLDRCLQEVQEQALVHVTFWCCTNSSKIGCGVCWGVKRWLTAAEDALHLWQALWEEGQWECERCIWGGLAQRGFYQQLCRLVSAELSETVMEELVEFEHALLEGWDMLGTGCWSDTSIPFTNLCIAQNYTNWSPQSLKTLPLKIM